jgi:hypothetical protein
LNVSTSTKILQKTKTCIIFFEVWKTVVHWIMLSFLTRTCSIQHVIDSNYKFRSLYFTCQLLNWKFLVLHRKLFFFKKKIYPDQDFQAPDNPATRCKHKQSLSDLFTICFSQYCNSHNVSWFSVPLSFRLHCFFDLKFSSQSGFVKSSLFVSVAKTRSVGWLVGVSKLKARSTVKKQSTKKERKNSNRESFLLQGLSNLKYVL